MTGLSSSRSLTPPRATSSDTGHAVVRAVIGSIPAVGNAAVEIFGLVVTPPIERRRQEWMAEVGQRIEELTSSGRVSIEDLQKNERFIDAVLQTTQSAIKTASDEKRHVLLDLLVNVAVSPPVDESQQQIFIGLLDRFSPWHLRILQFWEDPGRFLADRGIGPLRVRALRNGKKEIAVKLTRALLAVFPELEGKEMLYSRVSHELFEWDLIKVEHIERQAVGNSVKPGKRYLTDFGEAFVVYLKPRVPMGDVNLSVPN